VIGDVGEVESVDVAPQRGIERSGPHARSFAAVIRG
jgi:hypothetical protein